MENRPKQTPPMEVVFDPKADLTIDRPERRPPYEEDPPPPPKDKDSPGKSS